MKFRLLRYFIAVSEEGHITRAAEKFGMQQPPLSQQIKFLERKPGVQLFRRLPRGVMLTEAGKTCPGNNGAAWSRRGNRTARGARRTRRTLYRHRQYGSFLPAGPASNPRVSRCVSAGGDKAVGRRERRDGRARSTRARRSRICPQGVCADGRPGDRAFARRAYGRALPSNHRPARGEAIAFKQLAGEIFVSYRRPEGPGLSDVIDAACRSAGFTPRFGQDAPRPASALNFVAAGHGMAVAPSSLQRMRLDGVCYRALKNSAQLKAPLNLISRRRETSPALRNFLKITARRA